MLGADEALEASKLLCTFLGKGHFKIQASSLRPNPILIFRRAQNTKIVESKLTLFSDSITMWEIPKEIRDLSDIRKLSNWTTQNGPEPLTSENKTWSLVSNST